jgi:hypothetical protein
MKNLADAAGSGIQLIGLSNRLTIPIVWLPVERTLFSLDQPVQVTDHYYAADMTDLYTEDCPSYLDRVIGTHFKTDLTSKLTYKVVPETVHLAKVGSSFGINISNADLEYSESDNFALFWQYLLRHNNFPVYSTSDLIDSENIMTLYAVEFTQEGNARHPEDNATISTSFCKKVGYLDADKIEHEFFQTKFRHTLNMLNKSIPMPIADFLKLLGEGTSMKKMDCPMELFEVLHHQYRTYKHLIDLKVFTPEQLFNDPENYRGNKND